jgi:hypothetical protein
VRRNVQVLLAWFERNEAITALLGFRAPEKGEDVSAHAAAYESSRAAMLSRAAYDPESALAPAPLPATIEKRFDAVIRSLQSDTDLNGAGGRLEAGVIDLRRVICFQKAVAIDEAGRRAAPAQEDWESLADLSLLPEHAAEQELKGTFDSDGRGVTLVSENPNLRVSPIRTVAAFDEARARVIGFTLEYGNTHIHVVEYLGRYFLKDGYHRCYGLLAGGATHAPVIVERGRSFADVHGGSAEFIAQEQLLGARPPLLPDFFDPAVSATVSQEAFRKAVRIRAETFVVKV